ncbi:hypothetical protein Nizo3894_2826 [Lactiplantibacillus plantarum]|nr:hypothetical protein Nizo2814_0175 [Lactiplantibacillus plantarum]KZU85807.1 hypothetical protein Nizo3894_2826 [Lactiplantibacillus plantarum]
MTAFYGIDDMTGALLISSWFGIVSQSCYAIRIKIKQAHPALVRSDELV